jgi:hypothetical protein
MSNELKQILDDIRQRPTVPIWPHYGKALGVSRAQAFENARSGRVETVAVGVRNKRVVSAWLRKILQLDGAA